MRLLIGAIGLICWQLSIQYGAAEEATAPSKARDDKQESTNPRTDETTSGSLCPLGIIDELPDETKLYYCHRFQPNCNATPTLDYLVGTYDWPCDCPPPTCCIQLATNERNYPGWSGYPAPGEKMEGRAGEFCEICPHPKVPVIQRLENGEPKQEYARLFVHILDTGAAQERESRLQIFGVAWEDATTEEERNLAHRLEWESLPGGEAPRMIFHARLESSIPFSVPMLILKKKPGN